VNIRIKLPTLHEHQLKLKESKAKRKVVRAGRRGGKTVCAAVIAVDTFINGTRVLYAAPTSEQVGKFWYEVTTALEPLFELPTFKKNESESFIEQTGTELRLKCKTAWNADTLRGDFAGLLILDEYQLMNEDTWEVVGAPMLLDTDGDAIFIYTPPSLRSAGMSKAHDPRHAAKMFRNAQADASGRWEAFTWSSHDNPYISRVALSEIIQDMSRKSYQQEILGQDDELELSWLVYNMFDEGFCKKEREEIPKNWHIYSGHDFGTSNPAALFVAQDPATGQFWEFKEYFPGSGVSIYKQVEEFRRITEGYRVMGSWGGSHQEEGIRNAYTAHGWPIREPKWNRLNEQLERVTSMMERNKIFIFKDLTLRLEELMNCTWAPDTEGNRTDKIKNEAKFHLNAASRYLYCNFTPETAIKQQPMAQYISGWIDQRGGKGWTKRRY